MTFTPNIPASGTSLGFTRPLIVGNFSAINTTLSVNHVSMGSGGAGKHKFIQIPSSNVPVATGATEWNLYTNTALGQLEIFLQIPNAGSSYQLTRTKPANFASFGTASAYGTPPAGFTQNGGWSYLPGGLLLQYGFYGKTGATGNSGQIQFPVAYTASNFSIQMTLYRDSGNQSLSIDSTIPPTTTTFNFLTSSAGSDGISWFSLGQ